MTAIRCTTCGTPTDATYRLCAPCLAARVEPVTDPTVLADVARILRRAERNQSAREAPAS